MMQKNILINGKLYQEIGVLFTSEIDGWEKLKQNHIGQTYY